MKLDQIAEAYLKMFESKVASEKEDNKFYSDIPNENWLSDKQKYANETYHRNRGVTGSVTGWFDKPVEIDVDKIKHLKGLMDEHHFREDPNAIKSQELEQVVKEDPKGFNTKEHPIFLTVNHKGEAYVSEGNHRLGYAVRNGHKTIHAEIRYFNGGERAEGPLHPSKMGFK